MNPFESPAPPPEIAPPVVEEEVPPPRKRRSWSSLFAGLAWVILCFELGAFLIVYPWMDGWDHNVMANWAPGWREVWLNPWLRGAVSGLGTVNMLIALTELFRYLRYWLFE